MANGIVPTAGGSGKMSEAGLQPNVVKPYTPTRGGDGVSPVEKKRRLQRFWIIYIYIEYRLNWKKQQGGCLEWMDGRLGSFFLSFLFKHWRVRKIFLKQTFSSPQLVLHHGPPHVLHGDYHTSCIGLWAYWQGSQKTEGQLDELDYNEVTEQHKMNQTLTNGYKRKLFYLFWEDWPWSKILNRRQIEF